MKYYLAIDIGASSGRHIVGWREGEKIQTREVYRFSNGVKEWEGSLIWDIQALFSHVKAGISAALREFGHIESLAIDTWGVDYVLLGKDGEILPCYAYRDARTGRVIPKVHKILPFCDLYAKTGIQFQPFNTVYQLFCDREAGRLDGAEDFLLLPCYLSYKLTGVKAHEYTDATTTGLVKDGAYDGEIVHKLGLPARLFPKLSPAGTLLGGFLPEVEREVGGNIPVVLCASHDTASAVEGIPMSEDDLYISSGTWSLLGAKVPAPVTDEGSMSANWSNEGGVGYIRYQKNIMGQWVVNRLREELCHTLPFPEIERLARESKFGGIVDVNAPAFLAPKSMKAAFDGALSTPPKSIGDYFRCAFFSLAAGYAQAVEEIERNLHRKFEKIYLVGGGAKNTFLNELTRRACDKEVVALPIEATALGNLKIQMSRRTI